MMISKYLLIIVLLLLPILAVAQQIENLELEEYQWENRLLLIFAPSTDMADYQQQLQELEGDEAGLEDRDLKVFHLLREDAAFVDDEKIAQSQVKEMVGRFKVNPRAFTVILIGKDGTEKLRQNVPLSTEELFSVIDAMPMRQREMQDGG